MQIVLRPFNKKKISILVTVVEQVKTLNIKTYHIRNFDYREDSSYGIADIIPNLLEQQQTKRK